MMLPRQLGLCLFLLLHSEVTTLAMDQTIGTQSPLEGESSSIDLNKFMLYIIAILIFIFFILGFISVYTRRCVDSRLRAHLSYRRFPFGDGGRRELPSFVVNTFPTFVYSSVEILKIAKESIESLECAVCLNEFEEDETLRLIPICNHVFHSQCIDVWLGNHSTCPVCRADLNPNTGDKDSLAVTIQGNDNDPAESDRRSEIDHETHYQVTAGTSSFPRGNNENQNRLPSSRSTGFRFSSLFGLSQSRDHPSPVQNPNEDDERFTLSSPEEARDHLVNPSLNRAESCVALPGGESCPRKGYRGEEESELGRNDLHYDRLGQEEPAVSKLRFTTASTFFNRRGPMEKDHENETNT